MKKYDSQNLNNGFTLIELVVVLTLMVILLSITIGGALAWQEWSRFQHEDACAETIFYAAQNQLTEWDSSRSIDRRVVSALGGETGITNYKIDDIMPSISISATEKYDIEEIWKKTNANNMKRDRGIIISLSAKENDYDKYLKGDDIADDANSEPLTQFDLGFGIDAFGNRDCCCIVFDWIFRHLAEWREEGILTSNIGISVYSKMLEKFEQRFGFEYKCLNPAKGKVYETTIEKLRENPFLKKRYPDLDY